MLYNKVDGYPLNSEGFFCDEVAGSHLELQSLRKKNVLFLCFKALSTLKNNELWTSLKVLDWSVFCHEVDEVMTSCLFTQELTSPHVFSVITLINVCFYQLRSIKTKKPITTTTTDNTDMDKYKFKLALKDWLVELYRLWHSGYLHSHVMPDSNNFCTFLGNVCSLNRVYTLLTSLKSTKNQEGIKDEEIPGLISKWIFNKEDDNVIKDMKAEMALKIYLPTRQEVDQFSITDDVLKTKIDNLINKRKKYVMQTISQKNFPKRTVELVEDKMDDIFYSELTSNNNIYDQMFTHHLIFRICPVNYTLCTGKKPNTIETFCDSCSKEPWRMKFFDEEIIRKLYNNYMVFVIGRYDKFKLK